MIYQLTRSIFCRRSIAGSTSHSDFARQAALYRLQNSGGAGAQKEKKKFRSSAPLGSKLPQGYTDRSKQLLQTDETPADDKETRLMALMQLVEEGQLTREEAVEQSRAFGGDVGSTHLVKGLDFRLLERARRGEDVYTKKDDGKGKEGEGKEDEEDMDDVLDKALEKEVEVVKRPKKRADEDDDDGEKKVEVKKKTRAEILEEFKRSRAEAAAAKAAENALGSKFKKFAEKEKKPKKGKESQEAADDGKSAKKRKREVVEQTMEEKIAKGTVLGMLPPQLPEAKVAAPIAPVEDEDMNIFDDAPDDYDPLAGMKDDSDDSDSDSEDGEVDESKGKKVSDKKTEMPPPPPPSAPNRPRNYFSSSSKGPTESTESISSKPLSGQDLAHTADLAAAIKKAAQMRELTKADLDEDEAKKAARHKAMLESARRDDEDMDMGFGDTRTFGDDDEEMITGGAKKRKRGGKKKT